LKKNVIMRVVFLILISVYYLKNVGVTMSVCKFDTFENETEISQMIQTLQSKSIEYMKIQDPWDLPASKTTKQKEKTLA